MAGERRLNWGADATDAQYRTGDDDASNRFVVAEDTDAGTILLEYDESAGEWVSRGPVNLSGNDLSNVGVIDAAAVYTDEVSNSDYNETVQSFSGSGTFDVDLSAGNVVSVAATGDVTLTFSNVSSNPAGNSLLVYFEDDDGSGPHTISWPASVVWDGGFAVSEIPGSGDIEVTLITDDGGTEWRGRQGGANFA